MKELTFEQVKVGLSVFIGFDYEPCKIVYISEEKDCRFPIFVSHPSGRVFAYAKDCISSYDSNHRLFRAERYDDFMIPLRETLVHGSVKDLFGWGRAMANGPESGEHFLMIISDLIDNLKTIEKELEEAIS